MTKRPILLTIGNFYRYCNIIIIVRFSFGRGGLKNYYYDWTYRAPYIKSALWQMYSLDSGNTVFTMMAILSLELV